VELSRRVQFVRFEDGRADPSEGGVVGEALIRLHVNGRELARLMCTPEQLDDLALGFLRSEGLIRELADVRLVVVCPSRTCVEVWLKDANLELPGRPVLTSGVAGDHLRRPGGRRCAGALRAMCSGWGDRVADD